MQVTLSVVSFHNVSNSTNAGKKGGEMRENKTEAQDHPDYVCTAEVIYLSNLILNIFFRSYLVLCLIIAKSNYQSKPSK